MYRIDQPHLLWVLDNLAQGKVVNEVSVHAEAKRWALVAVERMLRLSAGRGKFPNGQMAKLTNVD
jgi:quinolinate synthase